MSNEHERFAAHVLEWASAYPFTAHYYVGFKDAKGPQLLYGRIALETERPDITTEPFKFESERVIAGRFIRPATPESIADILSKAKNGEMDVLDGKISLLPEREQWSQYWYPHPLPFPSNLTVSGKKPSSHLRDSEIDWELMASRIPFGSLDELLSYLGLPQWRRGNDSSSLEISAKPPAIIGDSSQVSDRRAVVEICAAPEMDVSKLRVGIQTFGKHPHPHRQSIEARELNWQRNGTWQIASHTLSAKDIKRLHIYLSMSGVPVAQRIVSAPGNQDDVRALTHESIDPNFSLLKRVLLDPKKNESEDFEGAVATLLHVLGFSSCNYGTMRDFRDGADGIAVAPSGNVLVVECTTGHLDTKDKLAKLTSRTFRLKAKLTGAGHDKLEVLPIIVTPLAREEVRASVPTADKLGIAVVCKEELEKELGNVPSGPIANDVFNRLKSSIPRTEDFATMLARSHGLDK